MPSPQEMLSQLIQQRDALNHQIAQLQSSMQGQGAAYQGAAWAPHDLPQPLAPEKGGNDVWGIPQPQLNNSLMGNPVMNVGGNMGRLAQMGGAGAADPAVLNAKLQQLLQSGILEDYPHESDIPSSNMMNWAQQANGENSGNSYVSRFAPNDPREQDYRRQQMLNQLQRAIQATLDY